MSQRDSFKLGKLTEFLAELEIEVALEIRGNRTPPFDFALSVSRDNISNAASRGHISPLQMRRIKSSISEELGLQIEWLITPSQQTDALEAALCELLNDRYPDTVSTVFISALKVLPVSIWIERNSEQSIPTDISLLKSVVEEFLKLYGVENPIVIDGSGDKLPSNPMIMRKIKVFAPLSTGYLMNILLQSELEIPNLRWLQSKLDSLRKHGLLIRSKEGNYSLTEFALGTVPHGRGSSSSDIDRALALGRRRW